MKVQLVNPCMNAGYQVNSRNGVMHPLGLLSVGTYLREQLPDTAVEILDGSIVSRDEINRKIGADVVGCTTGVLSYEHALEIAALAKESGACVVFGGSLADELPREVLENRRCVDFAVMGDGEEALAQVVCGAPPAKIPNLAWRDGADVIVNPRECLDLDGLPYPDRSLVDVEVYFRNYAQINVSHAYARPMTFYSGKGCLFAASRRRCVFCARMDRGYRARCPELVWDELSGLARRFRADAFWDVADSLLSDQVWLKRFEEAKPQGFSPKLVIYGRPDAVTPEACERLRRLDCHLVFVGFESGSDRILRGVGLGKTAQQARLAAKLLASHGIRVMASFILGLPGETQGTIRETVEFVEWLGSLGNVETVSASVLMPLPGSQVYARLREHYPARYSGVDSYDLERARVDWLSANTSVSLEELYAALPRLLSVGQVSSSLGRPLPL